MQIHLPTIQNWSCHNCGGCCRQHAIEIAEAEYQRIESQGWTGKPGFGPEQPLFVWHAGPPWRKRYRLAHRADGACVFLDERGLCRIHAQFGENAKPLACQVYPYAFHPAGKQVTVSLRFSCPSVVANRGKARTANQAEIKRIERQVVPESAARAKPPAINSRSRVSWPDFLLFVAPLDSVIAETAQPFTDRLLHALAFVELVRQSRFDKLQGERLEEFLDLIRGASQAAAAALFQQPQPPTPLGRTQFRLLVAQYARKDTSVDLAAGWRGRWRLLRAAMQFARGAGLVAPLQAQFQAVPFAAVEESFGPLPPSAEELFSRYFRVKIQGLHFCGPAYYDIPLVEGFQSLALVYPVTLWLARWLAAGAGRQHLTDDDLATALATADHHHGYSPVFGQGNFRRRVRNLASSGDLPRLCAWYASASSPGA